MLREDRTSPKRVALKSTIPSLVSGIFMVTRRYKTKLTKYKHVENYSTFQFVAQAYSEF